MSKRKVGFGLAAIVLAAPMVAHHEGVILQTYIDPVGIPTACAGETDREIVLRQKFSERECLALLGASMADHAIEVAECVKRPVQPREAAALISWSYNIGAGAACKSTLVAKLNAGAPASEWCQEMHRWTYAKGKQLKGLVTRRKDEVSMCLTGEWKA